MGLMHSNAQAAKGRRAARKAVDARRTHYAVPGVWDAERDAADAEIAAIEARIGSGETALARMRAQDRRGCFSYVATERELASDRLALQRAKNARIVLNLNCPES